MDGISGVFRTQSNIYNLVFFQLIRPGLCSGFQLSRPGLCSGFQLSRPGLCSGFQLSRPGLCFNMKFDFFGMVTIAI